MRTTWGNWFLESRRGRRTVLRYTRRDNDTGASHGVAVKVIADEDENKRPWQMICSSCVNMNVYNIGTKIVRDR